MLIKIQAMVCLAFPLNILSTKKLLEKGHTVTLNSNKRDLLNANIREVKIKQNLT
jgi:hypothetical protein